MMFFFWLGWQVRAEPRVPIWRNWPRYEILLNYWREVGRNIDRLTRDPHKILRGRCRINAL